MNGKTRAKTRRAAGARAGGIAVARVSAYAKAGGIVIAGARARAGGIVVACARAGGMIIAGALLIFASMLTPPAATAYADEAVAPVAAATDTVDVSDIEIGDYKEAISVGETLDLTASVLPQNATEQTLSYASSDESVLTVDSKGHVKGISPGTAAITVSAGGITRRIGVKVRTATEYIEVDSDYLVMKIGELHTIKARAVPSGASQDIGYKSLDPKAASVTKTGVIKARAAGSASVLVSNGDMSVAIVVIVNKGSSAAGAAAKITDSADSSKETKEGEAEATLVSSIEASGKFAVSTQECPELTPDMLAAVYSAGADVEVEGRGYSIFMSGDDIVNTENGLATGVSFSKTREGVEFLLNMGRNLPGRLRLDVTDRTLLKEFVYLYNDAKQKYELLDARSGDSLALDVGGRYLMTDEKIYRFKINPLAATGAGAALVLAVAAFIAIKRRYWFW